MLPPGILGALEPLCEPDGGCELDELGGLCEELGGLWLGVLGELELGELGLCELDGGELDELGLGMLGLGMLGELGGGGELLLDEHPTNARLAAVSRTPAR